MNIKQLKNQTKTYAKSSKSERVEDGVYMARVVQIISLGVQKNEYQGTVKEVEQIVFTFELPTETMEYKGEMKPKWLSKTYTLSLLDSSALSGLLKVLDPKSECEEFVELIGKPCMVAVGSTATGNAKITTITAPMKGIQVPELDDLSKVIFFDFDNPDIEAFSRIAPFNQQRIKEAVNYNGFADNIKAHKVEEQKIQEIKKPVIKKVVPKVNTEVPFEDEE